MADQLQDSTANSVIIPELWSSKFFETLDSELPFNSLLNHDYEGEIKALGDTVNIPTFGNFSSGTILPEGSAGDAESVTVTSQQLVINSMISKDAIVTKKADLQSISFMDKLRDRLIYAIMEKMHSLIISAIVPSASNPDNAIAYDSGTTLGLADILEAKELLDNSKVSKEGRYAVLGTAQENDIFSLTGFTSRDFIASGSPLTTGQITSPVCGFTVRGTTEVGNTSYWFHPSFMTIAVQKELQIEEFNLGVNGVRARRINADILMGYKQMDNKRVVTIS